MLLQSLTPILLKSLLPPVKHHQRQWNPQTYRSFHGTSIHAGIAVPTFIRIRYLRYPIFHRSEEHVAWAYIDAMTTLFTFFRMYDGWHRSPLQRPPLKTRASFCFFHYKQFLQQRIRKGIIHTHVFPSGFLPFPRCLEDDFPYLYHVEYFKTPN